MVHSPIDKPKVYIFFSYYYHILDSNTLREYSAQASHHFLRELGVYLPDGQRSQKIFGRNWVVQLLFVSKSVVQTRGRERCCPNRFDLYLQ